MSVLHDLQERRQQIEENIEALEREKQDIKEQIDQILGAFERDEKC